MGPFLPMLKAVIRLKEDPDFNDERSQAGGVVLLTSLYRYGSYDLLELAVTVRMLYELGDQDMKSIINRRLVILLVANPQVKTPSVKDRWNFTTEAQSEWRSIVQCLSIPPISVQSNGKTVVQDDVCVDAFLDAVYWQSYREGNSTYSGDVALASNVLLRTMLRCARAVSRGIMQANGAK